MAQDAKIKEPYDRTCLHKRNYVRVARVEIKDGYTVFGHHNCYKNQMCALRNRVVGAVPVPSKAALRSFANFNTKHIARLPGTPAMDVLDVPDFYSGSRRRRFQRGLEYYLAEGVASRDAWISMFVKFEKTAFNKEKINPDPRAIQFRGLKYCVLMAKYLKPIEHIIYNMCGDGKLMPKGRLIGKGCSMNRRAALAHEKWTSLKNPVCCALDMSRFDQHVSLWLLRQEHRWYKKMNPSKEFAKLLRWQENNKGMTSSRIKYQIRGKRMSGDMNTALGNCILMLLMTAWGMEQLGIPVSDYNMLDDGDDNCLFVEAKWLTHIQSKMPELMLSLGMVLKIEKVSTTFPSVLWCQGHPVETAEGWKFVRKPAKVLSAALINPKHLIQGRRQKLISAIGYGELALNRGVPVLQAYARALIRAGDGKFVAFDPTNKYWHLLKHEVKTMDKAGLTAATPGHITDQARLTFHEAFGIPPAEQVVLEDYLDKWTFTIMGSVHSPATLLPKGVGVLFCEDDLYRP